MKKTLPTAVILLGAAGFAVAQTDVGLPYVFAAGR
jgi:hypothetical protein